ncbi:MAG: response regulator [Ardenticatenia bacterium]|nr:MAG: response regulator [Ardenticatenia bacterium]
MHVVAFEPDLFFSVRIETTLRAAGYKVHMLDTDDVEHALALMPGLIIVDIGTPALDWERLIRTLRTRAPMVPVLAFGSHMDTDARERALAAGASLVVARSRFVQAMPDLVARLTQEEQAS